MVSKRILAVVAAVALTALTAFGISHVHATGAGDRITTFMGTGVGGYNGDSNSPALTQLDEPWDIEIVGNDVYVVDEHNCMIRRISGGTVTRVAGKISAGAPVCGLDASTDADDAAFDEPYDIAFGPDGTLFVTDTDNCRVRAVKDGVVSTIFGSTDVPCGLTNSPDGDNDALKSSGTPFGLAVFVTGSGQVNVYFSGNCRIRRLYPDAADPTKWDVAVAVGPAIGSGSCGFNTDPVAPTSARFWYASNFDMVFDSAGNMLITDKCRVRRVTPGADGVITGASDETVTTVAGAIESYCPPSGDYGPASASHLDPSDVRFKGADLYVAEHCRVRRIAAGSDGIVTGASDEIIYTVAGGSCGSSGDDGPADAAALSQAKGIAFDASGRMHISDHGASKVRLIQSVDADGDGYDAAIDNNDVLYCGIMRADVNYDGVVNSADVTAVGAHNGAVNPGRARWNQNGDSSVNSLDLGQVAQRDGQVVTSCP